jgi:hypothetical protein
VAGAPRIPVSKKEILALRDSVTALVAAGNGKGAKVLEDMLEKIQRAAKPSALPAGIGSQKFIEVLSSVCSIAPPGPVPDYWHARVGKAIRDHLVTVERTERLGRWMKLQGWLKKPVDVDMVIRNLAGWMARAEATADTGTRATAGGPAELD